MSNLLSSSVYSIITDEYSGRNISEAFTYLVKVVIKTKKYHYFKISTLCTDFEDVCGFSIPYHPMLVIINQLISKGYISKSKGTGYIPKEEYFDSDVSTEILEREQKQLELLIDKYIVFFKSVNNEMEISHKEALEALNSFIESNGITLLKGSSELEEISDNVYVRSFYLFYKSLENSETELIEYIGSLIVGRILTDIFISGQNESAGNSRSNAAVYFDTSVLFPLLEVDIIDRSPIYLDLIHATQNLGMKTRIFYHTYNEMLLLIDGAKQWVGNPEYNPLEATASTKYFISNNFSKEKIDSFASSLKDRLSNLGIEIDNMSYPEKNPRGVLSEQEYYDLIVNKYKTKNPNFDELLKQKTVDKDARSLFYIDYLNAGIRACRIQSINNIFITCNQTLASISKAQAIPNSQEIPYCVNDIYWGTLIWLNNPQKLMSSTKVRVAANAYAAFLPSSALLKKLVSATDELKKAEKITLEESFFLKTSNIAQQVLMELTKGDEACFSEQTPLDILELIKNEAREQGKNNARAEANITIDRLNNELKDIQCSFQKVQEENSTKLNQMSLLLKNSQLENAKLNVEYIKNRIANTNDRYHSMCEAEHKTQKSYKIWTIFLLILLLAAIIVAILFTFYLYKKDKDSLGIISAILSILLMSFPILFLIYSGKPFEKNNVVSNILQRKYEKIALKYSYNKEDKTTLENEIIELLEDLKQAEENVEIMKKQISEVK